MKNMVVSFAKILGGSLVMGLIAYLANDILLGYLGDNSGNSRNGYSKKTLKTR
jgi:hypothetical protein